MKLDEMQMDFMPGGGTTDAIFIMRQLVEKHEVAGKNLHVVFVDLEKALDRVPRERVVKKLLDTDDPVQWVITGKGWNLDKLNGRKH